MSSCRAITCSFIQRFRMKFQPVEYRSPGLQPQNKFSTHGLASPIITYSCRTFFLKIALYPVKLSPVVPFYRHYADITSMPVPVLPGIRGPLSSLSIGLQWSLGSYSEIEAPCPQFRIFTCYVSTDGLTGRSGLSRSPVSPSTRCVNG